MSEDKKSKEYNEHCKSYAPYDQDIIIAHLNGMTDKELANVLERKIKNVRNHRTELIREFVIENIKSHNYFVWMATKFKLQNDLILERLSSVGITLENIDVSDKDIADEMKKNFDLAKNGEKIKDPKWKI